MKQWLDKELYRSIIKRFIKLFNVKVTNENNIEMVNRYLANLQPFINEIYSNLAKCELNDLNDDILYQHHMSLSNDNRYWVSKLVEYIYDGGYSPNYWFNHVPVYAAITID